MQIDVDKIRYARERGDLLRILKEDYQRETTSIRNLLGTLDALGSPLSEEDLCFHLIYLADQGYIRIVRAMDMPVFRNDRRLPGWQKPKTVKFAKLLPKGLQLLDGLIHEDPMVKF